MNDNEKRVAEIIDLAGKLEWVSTSHNTPYPLMQVSEVEKCMLALIDESYLYRLKRWANVEIKS